MKYGNPTDPDTDVGTAINEASAILFPSTATWCARKTSDRQFRSFACDIDHAIEVANSTAFGLSSGVCTNRLDDIIRFINELETGTVNIWEVPGYRIEMSPFGGIKDSGLGYKEGVIEAMNSYTNVKTFSLPW